MDASEAIRKAADALGGQGALALAIGVRQPTVSEWARGARPIPIERCVDIERATEGAVRRWDLRPDDWYRIWPELIGADGAPEPPADAQCLARDPLSPLKPPPASFDASLPGAERRAHVHDEQDGDELYALAHTVEQQDAQG